MKMLNLLTIKNYLASGKKVKEKDFYDVCGELKVNFSNGSDLILNPQILSLD